MSWKSYMPGGVAVTGRCLFRSSITQEILPDVVVRYSHTLPPAHMYFSNGRTVDAWDPNHLVCDLDDPDSFGIALRYAFSKGKAKLLLHEIATRWLAGETTEDDKFSLAELCTWAAHNDFNA